MRTSMENDFAFPVVRGFSQSVDSGRQFNPVAPIMIFSEQRDITNQSTVMSFQYQVHNREPAMVANQQLEWPT